MTADQNRPRLNELMPCGTPSAVRRHIAQGVGCDVCGTEGRLRVPASLSAAVERRRQERAEDAA